MNIEDANERNVSRFLVPCMEEFTAFFDSITPEALRPKSGKPDKLLGIPVHTSHAIPANKIAVCGPNGQIIGFFDMIPPDPSEAFA